MSLVQVGDWAGLTMSWYSLDDLWYANRNPPAAPRKVPSLSAADMPPRGGLVGSHISMKP